MKKGLLFLFTFCAFAASAQVINEFQPNPTGADPANMSFEILGTPGAMFSGWVSSIESDGVNGTLDRLSMVSGTFDANGILEVTIPDLENPSFTVVLSSASPGSTGDDLDSDNDGSIDDSSLFGTIYDAIGVPDNGSDVTYGVDLGGGDFVQPGTGSDEPMLVFRDAITGDWYWIQDPYTYPTSDVFDINGNAIAGTDFATDPSLTTFGAPNLTTALPIHLTTFTATKKSNATHLQWQTATEINNDYMAIEHSSNGRDFEEITRVKGAGTTYEAQSYEYTDESPLAGVNYYRLRQVDFDGKATLHNTVSVTFDKGEGVVRIIPTEAASEVMVYLPEQVRQTAQLRVYDLTGQLWMNQTLNRGTQERQLDVSALPQGHYFLQLIDGNAVETVRFNKI